MLTRVILEFHLLLVSTYHFVWTTVMTTMGSFTMKRLTRVISALSVAFNVLMLPIVRCVKVDISSKNMFRTSSSPMLFSFSNYSIQI